MVEAREEWAEVARRLIRAVCRATGDAVLAAEHVGSTAVPGLLCKPIIDLAVGLRPDREVDALRAPLEGLGWQHRGDDGGGGWLFVLEDRPLHRIAHLHVVEHEGPEWRNYLAFRDRLRRDPSARASYEAVKATLCREFAHDRRAYREGKESTIRRLLAPRPA